MKISRVRPELAFLDDYEPDIERDEPLTRGEQWGGTVPRFVLSYNLAFAVSEQELKEILGE